MIKQQRLSKLQKWILLKAYENGVERKRRYDLDDGEYVTKYEIYSGYYHLPVRKGKSGSVKAFFTEDPKHFPVDLSRSLHNLAHKGLIYSLHGFHKNEHIEGEYRGKRFRYPKPGVFYEIALTDGGFAEVKRLLAHENPY